MTPGTKISQLDFVNELSSIDYFPLARGASTKRISGLTLINAITAQVPAPTLINSNQDITLDAVTIQLSADSIIAETNVFNLTGSQNIYTDSVSAALKISQTGTGNVIEIEDQNYPNTTLLKVTSAGYVVIGTPTTQISSVSALTTLIADDAHLLRLIQIKDSNGDEGPVISLTRQRGNFTNTVSPCIDDQLGTLQWSAVINNTEYEAAQIKASVDGIPTGVSLPGRITFSTALSGNDAVSERMRITHDGKIGIGTVIPNHILTVVGNISANTIFANLTGNAETANKWSETKKITLSGAILGDIDIDGSTDVVIQTQLSAGTITDNNIAINAQINDQKLATISSPNKVHTSSIIPTGSVAGYVLASTGPDVPPTWQSIPDTTTETLADLAVTTAKIQDEAVTLTKTTATSANTYSSLVARNQFGEFAATNIYSNLEGNASTATRWLTPRQIIFEGAITGRFGLDGSSDVIVPVKGTNLATAWINFDGTQTEVVSCFYEQNDNTITIQTPVSQEVVSLTGIYTQGNSNIPNNFAEIYLLTGSESGNIEFAEQYLLEGSEISLTFLTGSTLDPEIDFVNPSNGNYTVQAAVPSQFYINVATTVTQYVTGEVIAEIVKTIPAFSLNHLSGHIVSLDFRDGYDLETDLTIPFGNLNTAGLYTILSSVSSNVIAVSSTLTQQSTGNVNIHRNVVNSSSNIVSVTPKNTGNYILNIYPALNNNLYTYTGTTRTSGDDLSVGMITTHSNDTKTKEVLEIRSVLNNGTLNYFDSNETNIIIYG